MAEDINSWWGKTFTFMKKARINTWKGVFIVAFISGAVAAVILTVSFNIQTSSDAANGAVLSLYTDETSVTVKEGSNIVNMDVLLNTHSNKVVVAKAKINYDPEKFKLESWDTSNSVFASGNTCAYNNKPCEIINHSDLTGMVSITLAKPSPGVNTSSGIIAQLVFKALKPVSTSAANFTLTYDAEGGYNGSDAISDDGKGTDILSGVENMTVNVYTDFCTSFEYSEWGACQSNGTQSRTVLSSLPAGCGGGNPILKQNCEYNPGPDECIAFTYSEWGVCQSSNIQTRTYTGIPAGCSGGNPEETERSCQYNPSACAYVYTSWGACQIGGKQTRSVASKNPEGCVGEPDLEQDCDYQAPVCVDYNYSDWSVCQPDDTRTRSALSGIPAGCQGGTPSVIKESCDYAGGPELCREFTYNEWGACQLGGKQHRTVAKSIPDKCKGGEDLDLEQDCEFKSPVCSGFTYSEWGACQSNGKQIRTTKSGIPAGCAGGNPELTKNCQYVDESEEEEDIDESGEIDIERPDIKIGDGKKQELKSKTIRSDKEKFSFKGKVSGGSDDIKVRLSKDGKKTEEVNINSKGDWDIDVKEKKDGTYTYKLEYIDSDGNEIDSKTYKVKVDTTDPEFIDLPLALNKNRGDRIWWKASDDKKTKNEGIAYYRYKFVGQGDYVKTEKGYFNVPTGMSKGVHILFVRAYDEAGNNTLRVVTVRIK